MKFALVLITLMMTQMSFGQTLREERIKKEMLDRTDLLITKVSEARKSLESKDVESACKTIKEMFEILPDHVKGIGGHMDLSRSKSIKAKDEALFQLISIHKKTLICDQGDGCEYVNMGLFEKELKRTQETFEMNKKVIMKANTMKENYFSYEYEF